MKSRSSIKIISGILIAMFAVSGSAAFAAEDAEDQDFEKNYTLFEEEIRECTAISGFSEIAFFDITGDGRAELLEVYAEEQVDFSIVVNIVDLDAGSLGKVPCSYGTIDGFYDGSVVVCGGHMDDFFSKKISWDGEALKTEDLNTVDTSQITDPDERDKVMKEGLLAGLDMAQYTPAQKVYLQIIDGQVERL